MVIFIHRSTPLIVVALMLAFTALSGCTTARSEVRWTGTIPVDGSYAIVPVGDPTGSGLMETVARRLRERGLAPAAQPSYLVQIGFADRAAFTELRWPGEDPSEVGATRHAPRNGRVQTLSIGIVDARSGIEAYRASAMRRASGHADSEDWTGLLDAVLPSIPLDEAP